MLALCLAMLDSDRDQAAFRVLYGRCRGLLFQIALGFFHDQSRSEEAVQDAFLAAAQNFSKILPLSAQEQDAYLVIIVKNKCRDILRREKKYVPEEEAPDLDPAPGEDSVHAAVESADVIDRVAGRIGALPGEYREILQRRLLLEQSNAQVARAMGLSESAVSRRFEKGRVLLAEALRKEGIGLDR